VLKLDHEVLQNLRSSLHGRTTLGENFILAINDHFGFAVVGGQCAMCVTSNNNVHP
jgi:hypothetical protein